MMTITKITNEISKKIQQIANEIMNDADQTEISGDFQVVICPERIFFDDYLPKEEEYIARNEEMPEFEQLGPNDSPYKNTVFIVLKFGTGQRNYAVSQSDLNIQVVSEENDFTFARELMDRFIARWNFKYDPQSGFIMSFFNPSNSSSQDEVYAGFRTLMNARGFVRVPEAGMMFISEIIFTDGDASFSIPFINLSYNYTAQPDPASFSGFNGKTMALNKQSTTVASFNTYLTVKNDDESNQDASNWLAFSNAVFAAIRGNMNKKFSLTFRTPYIDDSDPLDEKPVDLMDSNFVLVGFTYNQELGDISPISLTFAEAKKEER